MSMNSKLGSDVGHDEEDPKACEMGKEVSLGSSDSKVYKILHGFIKQGNTAVINIASTVVRRASRNRSTRENGAHHGHDSNLQIDGVQKKQHAAERKSVALISGTSYCISSCSMILLNKVVLSSYGFNAGISLMFYQNLVSVIVIVALGCMGAVSIEEFSWKLIRLWVPVNLIFIGMLVTGMYSLKFMNIAMVTILKNVTNIITAIGECYFFRKHQSRKVWTAMLLMIISAMCGGITDLSFDAMGYSWQLMNCILTAGYSLIMCKVMDKAKQSTRSGSFNEVSMSLLNNTLSLPFAILLILLFNEWEYVYNSDVVKIPMFWFVATVSGLLGLAISFTSIWFLNQTGPTTYSLVGSLNKIPVSVAGILLFNVPLSAPNFLSILFGLFAGVFFAKAKMS